MQPRIDHLVIGADSLTQGVDYVRNLMGVDIPYGGEHIKMGTHNHLMKLGDGVFLEVIAINRHVQQPERPRWYGLDDPFIRQKIKRQPTFLTWVINTHDIDGLIRQAIFSLGESTLINRGSLSWNFGLPKDGRLLAGGLLPYAIEWHSDKHPSENMTDLGCSLHSLEIYHPYPFWLQAALESIDSFQLVKVIALPENETPYIVACICTQQGITKLYSHTAFNRVAGDFGGSLKKYYD
ncbi:MAG: VOC family protein [Deltaproteobacteria bacterium]|nr:VOC family protein [Candidatus Desulfobacula maris]